MEIVSDSGSCDDGDNNCSDSSCGDNDSNRSDPSCDDNESDNGDHSDLDSEYDEDESCSHSNIGSDVDIVMDDISAHHISLDSVIDSECEDLDPEDEVAEEGGKGLIELNRTFAVELGVVPPQSACNAGDQRPPPYTAGCIWTREDWSCSYDAIFMTFWSLYEQSSESWRRDWIECAPDWNTPLGHNFDHLIILAGTPVSAEDRTRWFCRYRDCLRDRLSNKDPDSFPRRGRLAASATQILEILFGRTAGPYLQQHLICRSCREPSWAGREFCFLMLSTTQKSKTPIWLHTAWAEFIDRSKMEAAVRCPHCKGPNDVQDLGMPEVPWIWFERDQFSPVWPSLTLEFHSPSQQLRYSLRAIIYAGGHHFTVRFRDQSGRWWKHDGQVASGVPQPDNFQSEAQLLMNHTRFACILIYHRDGH